MSGLSRGIFDRWRDAASIAAAIAPALASAAVVDPSRMFIGRLPDTRQGPWPAISVIRGATRHSYRTDQADGFRVMFAFHVYADDGSLHVGEQVDELIRRVYANQAWDYQYGRVIDCLDGGPGTAHEPEGPVFMEWEIVRLLTLCVEQRRVDGCNRPNCNGGFGGSPSSSSSNNVSSSSSTFETFQRTKAPPNKRPARRPSKRATAPQ